MKSQVEGEIGLWWSFLENWCELLRIFFSFKNSSSRRSQFCLHFAVDIADLQTFVDISSKQILKAFLWCGLVQL